jgi:ABC-type nickel/cobalt efflux system permease component RcnA
VHIDWATLGAIAVVAAAVALTTVLLVSFALVGLSARSARQRIDGADDGPTRTHATIGTAVAAICLVAAGLIVCYGLYLIIA